MSRFDEVSAPGVGFLVVLRGDLAQQGLDQGKVTRAVVIEHIVITQVAESDKDTASYTAYQMIVLSHQWM